MPQYELLLVIAGTLDENEVEPVVGKIKEILESGGAQELAIHDLGKSRLAYPIKHIRYGYFRLVYFQSEPQAVKDLQAKLQLMPELLRVLARTAKSREIAVDRVSAVSDVYERVPIGPGQAVRGAEALATETAHRVDAFRRKPALAMMPVSSPAGPTAEIATKAEEVKLDEIDKKLDELLEGEIADV